ncbi:MAG: hypothetical protein DWI22_14565 [Planctomycetota bacterium]|nr:MAG: hypothetical protein DWI22_14565 [Planctomycetota bacterium]
MHGACLLQKANTVSGFWQRAGRLLWVEGFQPPSSDRQKRIDRSGTAVSAVISRWRPLSYSPAGRILSAARLSSCLKGINGDQSGVTSRWIGRIHLQDFEAFVH